MNTNTSKTETKTANAATAAKARAAKKPPSAKRMAAEAAAKAAKSDQEKKVANAHLRSVRFEDLARARTRRALKTLSGIENLANRAAYAWTEEQAGKILKALDDAMKRVSMKFAGQKETKQEFDL